MCVHLCALLCIRVHNTSYQAKCSAVHCIVHTIYAFVAIYASVINAKMSASLVVQTVDHDWFGFPKSSDPLFLIDITGPPLHNV